MSDEGKQLEAFWLAITCRASMIIDIYIYIYIYRVIF